jgi:hypothetical protein
MHVEAHEWVYHSFHDKNNGRTNLKVLEIGSLDINGSVRNIFKPFAGEYIGLDPQEGPGVDVVMDAMLYNKPNYFDVIVTAETFEHTPYWKDIIKLSHHNLVPGGLFIATMAGEGRQPHSAIDENPIREWEHYANIGAWDLKQTLKIFDTFEVNILNQDLRCWACKKVTI